MAGLSGIVGKIRTVLGRFRRAHIPNSGSMGWVKAMALDIWATKLPCHS